MGSQSGSNTGPDLTQGVPVEMLEDGVIIEGRIGKKTVILAKSGDEIFAVGGVCTHYSGPLSQGIIVGDTVRCPWHHACFSLRTGEALGAPAFDPIACWKVEHRDGRVFVTEKAEPAPARTVQRPDRPERIVIIGGGAAGFAAAEMLRRLDYAGELTVLSSDADAPYDRPNLSKDYLSGAASEDWIPLRSPEFYVKNNIDLRLETTVSRIDGDARTVLAVDGQLFPFDRLLLATGAEPVRLAIPGAEKPHVFILRSLADSRAIIERAKTAKTAVVVGAGFIGLEVAGALRTRGVDVHVVAPGALPLQRVLGPELGELVRTLHERHGVTFHLNDKATSIGEKDVTLQSGGVLAADLVVVGIGVKPRTALARDAGINVVQGVLVDDHLETSIPGIFAAGDVAEWPDATTGELRRIEHWVVAERQGQTAAFNMLGARRRFTDVPFFWSAHYETTINYVGHAAKWDAVDIDGDIAAADAVVRYKQGGRVVAAATLGRDREALEAEVAMEADRA
ncbi:FAD-dependent oxidoreductase [Pseudaminobacter sp. NGMCC 1.201702]|uniref:FAD-dependent oxidoreductase n=1 Tax=Pseudaminobacter sp. NGMCC 1.201702 TaxID=3391825 RepID=UPI0039EEF6AC